MRAEWSIWHIDIFFILITASQKTTQKNKKNNQKYMEDCIFSHILSSTEQQKK